MGTPRAPYMAKTDKERLATGFWNRIESNKATDCNSGHTFCLFDDGRAGWVPDTAETGGRVAIFLGPGVPILLRPQGDAYTVVGGSYVHEMMDGQTLENPNVGIETITLV